MDLMREMTEADFNELDVFLARVKGGAIPNAEALNGFFAALHCCPDLILPSEYMDVLRCGEEDEDDMVFANDKEAQKFFDLVILNYNEVNRQLRSKTYVTVLLGDDEGQVEANDWANGFLTGTHMRHAIWQDFFNDEENLGSMAPIWALAYENHTDPKMRLYKEPITPELRDELVLASEVGVMRMYSYFLPQREQYLEPRHTHVRQGPKTGRNDPCPCGSGKKFKKCCGANPALH